MSNMDFEVKLALDNIRCDIENWLTAQKTRSIRRIVLSREEFFQEEFAPILGKDVVKCLIEKGFCSSPASKIFHGSYDGGLFDHSICVTSELIRLTDMMGLAWSEDFSPVKVGMLHDLCKVGSYYKNSDGGYEYLKPSILPGHGMKSTILAQSIIPLTDEEIACIVHHMGAYETDCWDEYDAAIRKYPNVLLTHTADMIASKIRGY